MNEWEDHFQNLLTCENPPYDYQIFHSDHDYSRTFVESEILNRSIELQEILSCLNNSSNGKAAGSDGITNEALKTSFGRIYKIMYLLFNRIFEIGILPIIFKTAHLKPLFKGKGQKKDTTNYRGISLLTCSYKLFTGVLYDRIERWTEVNQILPNSQFGFRKGRSTIQATTKLKNTIELLIASHIRYYECFVDFKKAFDTFNRQKLLDKLKDLVSKIT